MEQNNKVDVLIVGAGHAGAQCAISLRQQKFDGRIMIIGAEPELPYERPPLSKEYLSKEKEFERIRIRPQSFWDDKDIQFALGKKVIGINAETQKADLSDGEEIYYQHLVWAAGGEPRLLSCEGADLQGVFSVRTRNDIDKLMSALDNGAQNVAIIGGGYIGLESAAVLRKLGCNVTILEAQQRVLARVAGEELSAFYEKTHREHGVSVRTSVMVSSLEGEAGKLTGVKLASGEVIPADVAIVGIGIVPTVDVLSKAGATCSNGVDVDEFCRTSIANVFAIGDCAAHKNGFADNKLIRLESVQNANDQAVVVAKTICEKPAPYKATPWFWSNQYDLKLQTVGLSTGYDQTVLRGSTDNNAFTVIYLKAGKVIALDCINIAKDFVQGRKLVEAGAVVPTEILADSEIPLKTML